MIVRTLKHFAREWRKPRPATPAAFQRRLDILARSHLKTANAARDDGRWSDAAISYVAYLAIRPADAPIHVQHGNMLGQAGDLFGAEGAFRAALRLDPAADTWLQLGRILARQNRQPEAIEALGEALRMDPELAAVHQELVALGARLLIPRRRDQPGSLVADFSQARAGSLVDAHPGPVDGLYPLEDYDRFRKDLVALASPAQSRAPLLVVVDALVSSPARLRSTLVSLLDQDHRDWRALVVASAELLQHPVAAVSFSDDRISFRASGDTVLQDWTLDIVSVSAGTVLDPEALGWLAYARERTGASAVYCDHDCRIDHWRDGPTFLDPVLHPMPDAEDLRTTWRPPEVVILDEATGRRLLARLDQGQSDACAGGHARREVLLECIANGALAHLPRILASTTDLPRIADRAIRVDEEAVPGWLEPEPCPPPPPSVVETVGFRITVVIPTRDEAGLLEACVDSLLSLASRPERVSVVIADNRSREAVTADLLSRLAATGVEVLVVDEPFNWSRINNLAAQTRLDGALVFLNNDTRMLTTGWDDILCRHLQQDRVGVVGARLLYPDQTLQHAGMIFGTADGPPVHEGVDAPATAGGPAGRWRRSRNASAVTGAFLAVSVDLFKRVGGFEELTMAIGYSDIDFCLRVRSAGCAVVYAADIELTHYESRSRGRNESRGRVAWDQGELTSLRRRWGAALDFDPGYNPAWAATTPAPFTGFSAPTMDQVLQWLDRSAAPRPWELA